MSELRKITERWFQEVWNEGRVKTIDELLDNSCRVTGLGDTICCCNDFKTYHSQMTAVLDDINVKLTRFVSEDSGEYSGTFDFKATVKANGKAVDVPGSFWGKIKDGKIVETENIVDFVPLLMSLELIPADSVERALTGQELF